MKKKRRLRLEEIPEGFRPEKWCRRYVSEDELLAVLQDEFEFPWPDAMDIVNRYGLEQTEGAIIKTLANRGSGGVRRPRGWLIHTLRKKWGWKAENLNKYIDHEWEKAVVRLEGSPDITYQRIGAELRQLLAGGAPKIVPIRREET